MCRMLSPSVLQTSEVCLTWTMVTFRERMRLEELAQREAAGESFWSSDLDERTRNKLAFILDDTIEMLSGPLSALSSWEIWERLSEKIARDYGDAVREYDRDRVARETDPGVVFDLIESVGLIIEDPRLLDSFEKRVNEVFDNHRVSFQLAPTLQIIPRDSIEIHTAVTLPTLQLLHGRPDLAKAEAAYTEALREISDGKPAGAITHASVALQETLTALGASGNALGDQLKAAKAKTTLFAGRDQPLLDGISKVADWAAAERNSNGDAHRITDAVLDDAWMMVHVVGALILRLTGDPRK